MFAAQGMMLHSESVAGVLVQSPSARRPSILLVHYPVLLSAFCITIATTKDSYSECNEQGVRCIPICLSCTLWAASSSAVYVYIALLALLDCNGL
jgi:hypothetical protein